jgi:hypothetical protein
MGLGPEVKDYPASGAGVKNERIYTLILLYVFMASIQATFSLPTSLCISGHVRERTTGLNLLLL